MAPRSTTTIRILLAAAALGLAAAPTLAQQRGAAEAPRQDASGAGVRAQGPRQGNTSAGTRAQGPRRGDAVEFRGQRAQGPRAIPARSVRGQPVLVPSGIPPRNFGGVRARFPDPIGSSGGTLLDRGRPTFTPIGRMGGSDVPISIAQPVVVQDRRRAPARIINDRRRGFLADDDDFRFVIDLGGGNVWIGDDPVFAPPGYWDRLHRRGRTYRRYWYPQAAYFPGVAYLNTVPYGDVNYPSYATTFPLYTTADGAYLDPYSNPIAPQFVAPAPQPPPQPPRPITATERAESALVGGDPEFAEQILRDHLRTSPDDTDAMRYLAVALLEGGQPAQAVAVMTMAYDKDPTLAGQPLPGPRLFRDPDDLRAALNRAVTYANRVNTASSWLLVATLMQAEGRDRVARRMVERAADLGLDDRIVDPLLTELGA